MPHSGMLRGKEEGDPVYYDAVYLALEEKGFESLKEVRDYIGQFLIMPSDCLYRIEEHLYKIVAIDIYRMEVRLLETDMEGSFLYDGDDKTIKRRLRIEKFEKMAEKVECRQLKED